MTTERWQEFTLSLTALVWAVILALPDDLLGRVKAYAVINRFLPDGVWAAVLCLCALAILFATDRLWLRAQAHAILGIIWLLIVALIFSGGWRVGSLLIAMPFVALALLHIFEGLKLSQLARL